jgi:hypothetical protein
VNYDPAETAVVVIDLHLDDDMPNRARNIATGIRIAAH